MDDTLSKEFVLYPIATRVQMRVFERERRGINLQKAFQKYSFDFQMWVVIGNDGERMIMHMCIWGQSLEI